MAKRPIPRKPKTSKGRQTISRIIYALIALAIVALYIFMLPKMGAMQ